MALNPKLSDWRGRVVWLDRLPEKFSGCLIGNEVLDAMPMQLFVRHADRIAERGVALASDVARGVTLQWAERPADAALAAEVARIEAELGRLPAPYVSELPRQASAWAATVADVLAQGVALLIDASISALPPFLTSASGVNSKWITSPIFASPTAFRLAFSVSI